MCIRDRLKADLLGQTFERLSEQSRAERELMQSGLQQASAQLSSSIEVLTRTINERLESISGRVSERLDEGFKKTNETFASVMARLATIDEAQKKIDGLTTNVVSLQELLGDKKSRGAFGEVQLEALVRNVLPPGGYEFQASLPNGSRVDCMLILPEPTGRVAVDSKFPLENSQNAEFCGTISILKLKSLAEILRRVASSYGIPTTRSVEPRYPHDAERRATLNYFLSGSMSDTLVKRLFDELNSLVLIDPHTHISPHQPASANLADFLGYHYYTELSHSTGLPREEIEAPGQSPQEKVGLLMSQLGTIDNTAQYSWFVELSQKLFGFTGDYIDASTATIWRPTTSPAWQMRWQPIAPDSGCSPTLLFLPTFNRSIRNSCRGGLCT